MSKKILYISFYFEPDLCAGSFRNSPLAKELSEQLDDNDELVVISTQPNRYQSFKAKAEAYEERANMKIYRIDVPSHQSGFKDQIATFRTFFKEARKIAKQHKSDLVFASSSRLFTAYLGYKVARSQRVPLYLDIRDIFVDTMKDVLGNKLIRSAALPVLKYIERRTFSNAQHINLISGGFKEYFSIYPKPEYSYFPNGIDDIFLNLKQSSALPKEGEAKTIVYAGNIGEGQGLHKIVPQAAKRLGEAFVFKIIGDGGAKVKLEDAITQEGVDNVLLLDPVKREALIELYNQADFLFMHLNDFDAFKKVLPSKVFELACYNKPLIAGVGGFANSFVKENVPNTILFQPGDVDVFMELMDQYSYSNEERVEFKDKFKRSRINSEMATSIRSYLR